MIGRGGIRMKRLIRFWNPLLLITVFIDADFTYRDAPFDLVSSKIDPTLLEIFADAEERPARLAFPHSWPSGPSAGCLDGFYP